MKLTVQTQASTPSLVELENIIDRSAKAFIEAGTALHTIKVNKLHRTQWESWDDYCRARFAMTGRHANQLIAAAKVAIVISEAGTMVPMIDNERQARELVPLLDTPDDLVTLWKFAAMAAEGKPTGALIKAIREGFRPPADQKAQLIGRLKWAAAAIERWLIEANDEFLMPGETWEEAGYSDVNDFINREFGDLRVILNGARNV